MTLCVKSMGTFPVQRGRRCGGVRHTATAAGRAFGPSSLCYMTKVPLSPGFFPHRPGGYLKVPSQLTACPDPQQRSGRRRAPRPRAPPPRPGRPPPAGGGVWAPRNAAAPSPDPHNPQTRHSKGAQTFWVPLQCLVWGLWGSGVGAAALRGEKTRHAGRPKRRG